LRRCGHDGINAIVGRKSHRRRGYAVVFAPGNAGKTFWITSVFSCLMISTYYLLSWLPQMVADLGFSPSVASQVSGIVSLSGVLGGLTLGGLAQRISLQLLFTAALASFGLSMIILGLVATSLPAIMVVSGICGFFLFGAGTGAYATLATTFDDTARVSGTGFAIGIGRIVSAFGPSMAGWMLALGLSQQTVALIFGCLCLVAAAILFLGWQRFRH
jgi:MFS family permease